MTDANPTDCDGDRLLERYQNGEEEALKELIRWLHPKLETTLYFATGDRRAVDDLVQECWYAIIPGLSTLNVKVSVQAWALSIARRKVVDWIRDNQQRRKNECVGLMTPSAAESNRDEKHAEKMKLVYAGIEKLPPSQKMVLELFYLENLTLKEVSMVLDISEGTVKSRLFTAREFLKQTITKTKTEQTDGKE